MEKIKWGILGCGDVAEVKSGPAFQKIKNSELLAVMRRDGEKAKDFAKRHQVPLWYDNVEDLLKNDDLDAIYIATPPSTHFTYAKRVLDANKHVYLEKPMVLNKREGAQLVDLVQRSKKKLTVAHYRRFLPSFIKVKELIEGKAIGDIRFADIQILQAPESDMVAKSDANWRIVPSLSGGGYFNDLAPHQIDLMYYYFGDYEEAFGFSANQQKSYNASDIVSGIVAFKNNIQFRGIWCFNVSEENKRDQCVIYGSKGFISFSFYGNEVTLHSNNKTEIFNFENPVHIQQPMIEKVVNYFLGHDDNPCSVEDGLVVTAIMEAFCS